MKSALIALLGDRVVAYHPSLAKTVGGVKPALLLSQLLYWNGKQSARDGWIYKTDEEMGDETGLSEREIAGARQDLVEHGFVEAKRRGVPARMNYRINEELVVAILQDKLCGKRGTSSAESAELELPEAQNLFCGKRGTNSEITSENTQEITQKNTNTTRACVSSKFEEAWKAYPKREGGNSKTEARKKWDARVNAGDDEQEMLDGVMRYAAYCKTKNIVGSMYVKQASSFFGPAEHWKESWEALPNGCRVDGGIRRDKNGYAIPAHQYNPQPIGPTTIDPAFEAIMAEVKIKS